MRVVVSLILLFGVIQAQAVEVKAVLSSNQILIGEQLTLTLSATGHAAEQVDFPTLKDTIIKEIEVLKLSKTDTAYAADDVTQRTITYQYILTSFDSGYYAIPPFEFNMDGQTYPTEPLLLMVQTIQTDPDKMADIKAPIEVPVKWWEYFMQYGNVLNWILGILLTAMIATIVIVKFWPKKEQAVVKAPPIPPHRKALQRLQELESAKLWQQDKVKEYHSTLSEIVRQYIEGQFKVPALEQTTDEIMSSLKYANLDQEMSRRLRELLFLSDMVKFAKEKPLASDNERVLQTAYEFIHQTKPKVELDSNQAK